MTVELREDERRLLSLMAKYFSSGVKAGRRRLVREAQVPAHEYSATVARLVQLGMLHEAEVPTEAGLRYCGRTVPPFQGNDDAVQYVSKAASNAYEMIKAFYSAKSYMPGPAELARLLGVSRQRAHQLLRELGRLEVIPAETRRVRKET